MTVLRQEIIVPIINTYKSLAQKVNVAHVIPGRQYGLIRRKYLAIEFTENYPDKPGVNFMPLGLVVEKVVKCLLLRTNKYFFEFVFDLRGQLVEEVVLVDVLEIEVESQPNSVFVLLQVCTSELPDIPQVIVTYEVGLYVLVILH